ncbi:MAG: glutamine-hydrolyzing carbamoyl-phosphate synthase small subunit [Candidatus Ancillula sp.]|jgi:carbamoyl-phosphate synthase small subunit|nr:glutamine-hydrolyzing carbamoyl-phosphate synthase small subunit [Candidatus Ancillula sp.]
MNSTVNDVDLAVLVLENGKAYMGKAFGFKGITFGELVFATGMTGYQETLTDPSYFGQVVMQTEPQIGNTGVNDEDNESDKIWVNGYVVREPSIISSNWRSKGNLQDRLKKDKIVGISNLDTRMLTKNLRDNGAQKCGIFSGSKLEEFGFENSKLEMFVLGEEITATSESIEAVKHSGEMVGAHFAEDVTTKDVYIVPAKGKKKYTVAAVDLGIKAMTPELLSERGVEVHVFPLTASFEELMAINPDGVFFSNGPGDPGSATVEVETLQKVLENKIPFFGICMGNQMLGRALGFGTYKLKFGHRGINQPVKDLKTGKIEITAHNHGFAVDLPIEKSVIAPADSNFGKVRVSHIDLNDNVVEGIECEDIPAFSVQYHPEAAAGPHDAAYLFDRFIELIESSKKAGN